MVAVLYFANMKWKFLLLMMLVVAEKYKAQVTFEQAIEKLGSEL
jgi:hypothetical protein